MKKPTQKEELEIYRNLLVDLHEARWTGNNKRFTELMYFISAYSYARTNSNGDYKQEEENRIKTLLKLKR